jgi:menaquinone-dependent protoporphyrinogen oxidase
MAKVLLLYASREGQTEKIAERISGHLQANGATVRLINAADAGATQRVDPSSYDLLVFGASVHAGGLEAEMMAFIERNAESIAQRPRSFFLVSLSAATRDPQQKAASLLDVENKARPQLAVEFADIEMIAGALRYSKYPLPLKWLMKRIAARAGEQTDSSRDYEYTDWQQVERYAARLTELV